MEKGILFNGDMVRAIIDGKKTVTRRPFGVQPQFEPGNNWGWITTRNDKRQQRIYGLYDGGSIIKSPYAPGDRVYVRETWNCFFEDEIPEGRPKGPRASLGIPARPERKSYFYYAADGELIHPSYGGARWRPSIHMPKQAARIWMTVASVRPERAKDITEEDARREGFENRAACIEEWLKIFGEWTACFWAWRIEFEDIEIKGRYES